MERAAADRTQTVLIAGESGVGKTRLLQEFSRSDAASGARWLSGECIALTEGELPYAPITTVLRSIPGELEDLDLTPESAPELARLVPEMGPLIAADPSDEGTPPFTGGGLAQGRLFEQFLSLLVGLARKDPVVLAVEDLHWADRSTRDLLSFLISNSPETPLLLICTYRSDELHRRHPLRPFLAQHERLESVERLDLEPFTAPELAAQLEGIFGAAPDPKLAARLFERSEGNAFFTEELLAASHDRLEELPPNLRDALMLRVEALSAPTQEVLRVAAAAGRSVPHRLLAALDEPPEPGLSEAIREAVAHQILVQDSDRESYAFRHALLMEAVSADLLPGERTRLHLALAEALAADPGLAADPAGNAAELAFHWRACHRLEDALAASVEAGLQAERSSAFAEANRHFENALDLWDRVEDAEDRAGLAHASLLIRAAENAGLSGQAPRAVALGRSAVDETDAVAEPRRAGLAQGRLGQFLWLAGDSDGALEALRKAVALLPSHPPSVARARLLATQGQILMIHGRAEESRARCEEAISVARSTGARAEEGHALNTLGCDLLFLGERRRAIELISEAKRIAQDCSSEDLWRAYGNLAEALEQDGRAEEGIETGIQGIEVMRGLGQRHWTAYVRHQVASQLLRLGRLDAAEELIEPVFKAPIEGIDMATIRSISGEIDLHRGNLEQAQRKLEQAAEEARQTTDVVVRAALVDRPALLAVVQGDPDRAAALVDEELAKLKDGEYVFYTSRMYAVALRAHADRAERARALSDQRTVTDAESSGERLIERLERLLEPDRWPESAPPESTARAALAAAELERLKGVPAPDRWTAAAARWADLGFGLDLAYSRWRQAEAVLAAGGTRVEASGPLREAAQLTADCGASLLTGEIEALSRRARIKLGEGTDAASTPPSGAEVERFGLTDRELDVLALIVEGRTNREIGETLFISTKTASAHVSHILSKLDVRSRIEAATAAHRLGLAPTRSPAQTESPAIPGHRADPQSRTSTGK